MNGRLRTEETSGGYCLAEVLLAISLLSVLLAMGVVVYSAALGRQEARGCAQSTQAAAAWAQIGVLWLGGDGQVVFGDAGLAVESEATGGSGGLGGLVPSVEVTANVARWRELGGIAVRFVNPFAAPDSGGSLYFASGNGAYRIIVRPVSGLTTRRWEDQ